MIFIFYQLFATPLFLIAQSKLEYPFFPKSQQVIGTNGKKTKSFQHYSYICRCPVLSNRCMFGLANQLAGSFVPASELELNKFRPLPFRELLWHLSTQVINGVLAAQITVFEPSRDTRRCFLPCLVYALVCPSIASNLVTLATLSPWSESVCMHTCSPLMRKPLLR